MSEQETPQSVAVRLYRYCKREYDCPHPSEDDVADALAAAEERGRRAGTEERDRLLREARKWLPMHKHMQAAVDLMARIDAALAPRDSAPATDDYQGCGDPAHDCRDGVCGAGLVPRDSGKEDRK